MFHHLWTGKKKIITTALQTIWQTDQLIILEEVSNILRGRTKIKEKQNFDHNWLKKSIKHDLINRTLNCNTKEELWRYCRMIEWSFCTWTWPNCRVVGILLSHYTILIFFPFKKSLKTIRSSKSHVISKNILRKGMYLC